MAACMTKECCHSSHERDCGSSGNGELSPHKEERLAIQQDRLLKERGASSPRQSGETGTENQSGERFHLQAKQTGSVAKLGPKFM